MASDLDLAGSTLTASQATLLINPGWETDHYDTVVAINADEQKKSSTCSGTLITTQHVLTAAHCVDIRNAGNQLKSDLKPDRGHAGYTVSIGLDAHGFDAKFQSRRVSIHPAWWGEGYLGSNGKIIATQIENDLAIITLEQPIDPGEGVLSSPGHYSGGNLFSGSVTPGTVAPIVGYAGSNTRKVGLAEIDSVGATTISWVLDLQGEANTQSGDSGGPLFVNSGADTRLAGVHSTGSKFGATSTKVGPYVDWIVSEIQSQQLIVGMARVGDRVFAATKGNELWVSSESDLRWKLIGHAEGVTAMTSVNGKLFATTSDGKLWFREPTEDNRAWTHMGHAINVTAMTSVGNKLFVTTSDDKLWIRDAFEYKYNRLVPVYDANWTCIGHAEDVTAMTSATVGDIPTLIATTTDDKLWTRPAVPDEVNWRHVGHAVDVVALDTANGHLLAGIADGSVSRREIETLGWHKVGHASNLTSMTSATIAINGQEDSYFFGRSVDDGLWMRRAGVDEERWTRIAGAVDIKAMVASGSRLYGVSEDNRLWHRNADGSSQGWSVIGSVPDIVAMTASNGKLFAVTSDNRLVRRTASTSHGAWQSLGAGVTNVVDMATVDGKLLAVNDRGEFFVRGLSAYEPWIFMGTERVMPGTATLATAEGKAYISTVNGELLRWGRAMDEVNWNSLEEWSISNTEPAQLTLGESSLVESDGMTTPAIEQVQTANGLPKLLPPVSPTQTLHNANVPSDVNGDGLTTPLDALLVINRLNEVGSTRLHLLDTVVADILYYDVNGDDYVSPADVLVVINNLNHGTTTPAEGKHVGETTLGRKRTASHGNAVRNLQSTTEYRVSPAELATIGASRDGLSGYGPTSLKTVRLSHSPFADLEFALAAIAQDVARARMSN